MLPPLQSAYRPILETAVVKVCDDAELAADQGMMMLVSTVGLFSCL